jgi:hypothetical protein
MVVGTRRLTAKGSDEEEEEDVINGMIFGKKSLSVLICSTTFI